MAAVEGLDFGVVGQMTALGGLCVAAVVPTVARRLGRLGRMILSRAFGRLRPFRGLAHVIDGDTIVVDRTRVRLFGIDAPEMTQEGGSAAKFHLVGLVRGAEVEVAPRGRDVYGRTVARVRCGGRDLSKEMVRDGFARSTASWSLAYAATELGARLRGRGLWARSRLQGIGDPAKHRRRAAPRAGR